VERSDFLMTLPCYAIAANVTRDASGNVILDDNVRFVAPHGTDPAGQHLAIFTDQALAQNYLEHCDSPPGLRLIAIPTINDLRRLLVRGHAFDRVWIDLNPKTGLGRNWTIDDLISELDRIPDPPARPGDPQRD
jgi:hypothetical protein